MVLLFDQLFSCCIRKNPRLDIPDEHSRLIITVPGLSSPHTSSNSLTEDQKLRDKFGTIVRAKEGMMVNVAAQIPFNLHNKPLLGPSSRSTSRSASHRPIRKHRPLMLSGFESITPISSRRPSPSRQRSRSHSSSMPLYYDNDPTMDNEFTNIMEAYKNRSPILNARLVRIPAGLSTTGRGRARKRRRDHNPDNDTDDVSEVERTGKGKGLQLTPLDDNVETLKRSSPDSTQGASFSDDVGAPFPPPMEYAELGSILGNPDTITVSWGD